MNIKEINIFIDGNLVDTKQLDINETLYSIRMKLEDTISNSNLFINKKGDNIDISVESELILQDILIDDKNIKIISISNQKLTTKKNSFISKKNIPIEGAILRDKIGNLNIYQYYSKFSDKEESEAISLLFIGETGSGTTTLINSFFNALMDIEITDDFRYKIIIEEIDYYGPGHSQTYNDYIRDIKPIGNLPPIKVIDCPDLNGCSGYVSLISWMRCIFNNINTINAICFVIKSSINSLNSVQKFIFNTILDLFGKDLLENIIIMFTFCDSKEPQIVNALKKEGSIFDKIIPHNKGNWYYKFNNSAIYSDNINDELIQMFWKFGMKNLKDFIKQLVKFPRKSLTQSKEVLEHREYLGHSLEILSNILQQGLNLMEDIRQTLHAIQEASFDLNVYKGFEFKRRVPVWKSIPAPVGKYNTTCVGCNRTCHENCSYGPGESKEGCCAFGSKGYCTKCPGKCHYSIHQNLPILYICEDKEEVIINEDLKKRYYNAKNILSIKVKLINGLKTDFMDLEIKCIETQKKIKNTVDKLKQIALNSSSYESSEDIDSLIYSEESDKKMGYITRIQFLENLKKRYKILREVYKNENSPAQKFEQFKKEFLEKEKNMKKQCDCLIC